MFDDQIVTFELGDLDGDSRPELIVLTVDINKDKPERIRIFNISDGGELLERQIVDLASPLYWSLNIVDIKVMDLNNDCQPEVVVVPKGSGRSMYYIISTDPFGYLEDVAAFTTDYYTRDAEFADVDRDGDLDLVVLTDDGLWVIRNHLN